eukprot:1187006-Prorocentrum_minimum.AAC.3
MDTDTGSFQEDLHSSGDWQRDGCPVEMSMALSVCRRGVQRVHLVSAATDGAPALKPPVCHVESRSSRPDQWRKGRENIP